MWIIKTFNEYEQLQIYSMITWSWVQWFNLEQNHHAFHFALIAVHGRRDMTIDSDDCHILQFPGFIQIIQLGGQNSEFMIWFTIRDNETITGFCIRTGFCADFLWTDQLNDKRTVNFFATRDPLNFINLEFSSFRQNFDNSPQGCRRTAV